MPNGFLFTATCYSPLHAGTGQSIGKVDLPIQREKHTGYPCVYGSSLKGALRQFCTYNGMGPDDVKSIFGDEDSNSSAGGAIFTDLKILFFPVRASVDSFKWVISQKVVDRYKREREDILKVGGTLDVSATSELIENPGNFDADQHIILEDFIFTKNNEQDENKDIIASIKKKDVYLIGEDWFNYLVTHATQIIARNQLNDKKISQNLWYEEVLPAETVLYSYVLPSVSNIEDLDKLKTTIDGKIVQIGGGETVGYGLCKICVH